MADIKISALPTATTPLTGAELVPVVQGGVTKQTTATAIFTTGILPVANGGTATATPALVAGTNVTITGTWPNQTINSTSSATVTNVSVVSANGLAGTVANPTTTPAITLSTSVTGVVKGNGTTLSAATAGTDYVAPGGALGTPSSGTVTNLTGTASININGTVGATTPAAGTFTSLNTGQLAGLRNRIINGGMTIDQRNGGAAVTITDTVNPTYVLDRWFGYGTVASKFSVQQNSGAVTPPNKFINYFGVTSLSAYSVISTDSFALGQTIEGLNVSDLGWGTANAQTITLSFWVRSSLTGTFGGSLRNSVVNRSYPFTYTISVANTWEQKSVTVAGDTSGTWLTTNGAGIRIGFGLGQGSTFAGTSGAWASANYNNATGATSIVGTSGATFYITGVQLELGSTATPFEQRPYGMELALCQRYYAAGNHGLSASNSNGLGQTIISPTTIFRTSPTFTTTLGGGFITSTSITTNTIALQLQSLGANAAAAGNNYSWTASAEL